MSGPAPRAPSQLRCFLGAFGDAGHAFPMLALGAELVRRGHEVTFETWTRWRQPVEGHGMRFVAAPEFPVFPTRDRPLSPYEAVVAAVAQTRPAVAAAAPDVVVHDILTLAPALSAELESVPVATLIPHLYPPGEPGFPPFGLGAKPPRTRAGARLWRAFDRPVAAALRRGTTELNDTRRRVGLGPVGGPHNGLSRQLCLVATLPQLEYPRPWPERVHVVGPMIWEAPAAAAEPPPGAAPLVLVAPSTAQDPEHRLLRAALRGLAHEPVRILASWNRRPLRGPVPVPDNARLAEWTSYAQSMPQAALVICHAGHGTLVRALTLGRPVVAVPHAGDMPENAARLAWSGAGVRLPWPLLSPATLRHAVRRALGDERLAIRAAQLAAWSQRHNGPGRAADLVERLARGQPAA
ncbi:MAG: nucleotide disphospho-sugar-binding domain-containing protein [Solirubrobacteraceae bacterium]